MQGLDGEPIDFEWKIFPGATALDLLHEIQADLQGKHVTPENFGDRIIFMSMFNDIFLEKRRNEVSFAVTSRKIKEYASKFNDGHWAFLGPGEETKWYQGYTTNHGGKWDLRASQMVEDFENSGHPVFQGMSPLGRGILKKKNNRDTIHFNVEYCNIDVLYKTVNSANPVREDMKVLAKHPEKFKSSRRISSHWLTFRDNRKLRETEYTRTGKISIRCHLRAKLNSEQRRNSTIQSRKEIIIRRLILKMTDGENARQCAKNTQRPETGKIQGHTHRLIQTNKEIGPV